MSITYTDLPGTNYPDGRDVFENKNDVSRDMQPYVLQYKQMIEAGNTAGAKTLLETYPQLKKAVISADDFNKLQDAITAMQRFVTRSEQQVVFSATQPKDQATGDIWVNTAENNDIYVKSGGTYEKKGSMSYVDRAKNADEADNGIYIYTHTKTGKVHNLSGPANSSTQKGRNIKFITTAAWEPGDSLTINGETCRCFDSLAMRLENTVLFANTVLVVANLSGTATPGEWNCFFRTGSAVSNNLATLPANNLTLLQQGAGLTTVYNSVAEIAANENRLKKIMNNGNALDYFCRSNNLKAQFFSNNNFLNYLENNHKKMSVSTWNGGKNLIAPVTFSASDGITYVDGSFCYTNNCSHDSGTLMGTGDGAGSYIEYNLNGSQIIPWKFIFNSTYITPDGQNITIKGLTPEGNWVDISVATSLARNGTAGGALNDAGVYKEIYCTKTVKCTAVRVVFNQAYSIYPKGCRFYYL